MLHTLSRSLPCSALASVGLSVTLTINRSGSSVLVVQEPGQPSMSSPATISLRGDTLVFDAEGLTRPSSGSLDGP